MEIRHVLIKVDDQEKALAFYTSVLGFVKKHDVPMGPARWLSVVAPDDPDGTELVLEPNTPPPALAAQQALYAGRFPATLLTTKDIDGDYRRLTGLGVKFLGPPQPTGPVTSAFFEDTCGNIIVIAEQAG